MNKKSIRLFCISISCLIVGAACHVLRISEDPVKFKIGVVIGVVMIVGAIGFGIAGLVIAIKGKK